MTDPDQTLLAAVINRQGHGELVALLQNILERLEALEPKDSSPSGAEGEETGSEGESSSTSKEPVSQSQRQGY